MALACRKEKTAGLIARLKGMYEKPSAANKIYLMKKLFNTIMKEGGSVTEAIIHYTAILGQLSSVCTDFSEKVQSVVFYHHFLRAVRDSHLCKWFYEQG